MTIASVYFGDELGRYGVGDGHPFGPDRLHAFWAETVRQGLDKKVDIMAPVACDESALLRFHTPEYVNLVKRASETGAGYLDAGDTPAFKGVFEAGCYVVGSDLDALQRIVSGETPRVFIPIAGLHHARRDGAAGFCAFNDCGVIIETLRREYGIQRVAYVDIDAHHGDGVFYAFEDDPDVGFADLHEDGRFLYPGTGFASETGKGAAAGGKLNIPLDPGSDDDAFHRAWNGGVPPVKNAETVQKKHIIQVGNVGQRSAALRALRKRSARQAVAHRFICGKCLSGIPNGHQTMAPRILAETHSEIMTASRITIRISDTWGQASVFSDDDSCSPMPPAPTKPSTVDSRMLMSQRNTAMPAKAGRICGTIP